MPNPPDSLMRHSEELAAMRGELTPLERELPTLPDERFGQTFFRVEATSFEQLTLWERYSIKGGLSSRLDPPDMPRVRWEQGRSGIMQHVGDIAGLPVNVSCSWDTIDGKLVLFWDAVSRAVDHEIIDGWFAEHCDARTCNAMNFHLCLNAIEGR